MQSPPPVELGAFKVVRELGRGGMGVVFEAEEPALRRRVALKMLTPEAAGDPTALARLRREALAMGALHHPHVAQVIAFSEGPPAFIVMELLAGRSLKQRLAERGPLGATDACLVAVQILSALAAAHAAGIVHRDVKPANVFVVDSPLSTVFVKLLDFGVAKVHGPAGPNLTRTDEMLGSVPYMAPEQIRGEPVDCTTDIFAVGVLLYEVLAGRRPFQGATPHDVLVAILRGDSPPPIPGAPPALERVVRRALERAPTSRFLTAEEMSTALAPFLGGVTGAAPTSTTRTSTRPMPRHAASAPPAATHPARSAGDERPPVAATATGRPPEAVVAMGVIVALVAGSVLIARSVLVASLARRSVGGEVPPATRPPAAGVRGSCATRDDSNHALTCIEYASASALTREICTDVEGTWADAPCDRARAAVGCRTPDGTTQWFYRPTFSSTVECSGTVVSP